MHSPPLSQTKPLSSCNQQRLLLEKSSTLSALLFNQLIPLFSGFFVLSFTNFGFLQIQTTERFCDFGWFSGDSTVNCLFCDSVSSEEQRVYSVIEDQTPKPAPNSVGMITRQTKSIQTATLRGWLLWASYQIEHVHF